MKLRPLKILFPLSWLYGMIINLRNKAYDMHIFKSYKVSCKIISVGNITVGGSGKTPFVVYLANMLKNDGLKVALLSRGYGRKSKGLIEVHDGKRLLTDVYEGGDEPVMSAIALKDVPVVVCENRVQGAEFIRKKFDPDYILLDDGFQHRRLRRDLDIVILPADVLLRDRFLLPAGKLREPVTSLKRAGLLVFSKGNSEQYERLKNELKFNKIVSSTVNYVYVNTVMDKIEMVSNGSRSIPEKLPEKVLLVSAIANPERFKGSCLRAGVTPVDSIEYQDHKYFTVQDIMKWNKRAEEMKVDGIMVTLKDYVKISELLKNIKTPLPFFILHIALEVAETDRQKIAQALSLP